MTALQPLLVSLALALGLSMMVALAVRGLERCAARGSSAFWATAALAPIALGTLAIVALLAPGVFSSACHCAPHGDHHPHLCWLHPASAAPLVTPALVVVAMFGLLRGPAIGRVLVSIARSSFLGAALRRAPATRVDGVNVHVLDCGQPAAFTSGVWSPRIVVDRTLVEALDSKSLRAVVHHERAHALRRDGLTLAVLRLAAACFPLHSLHGAVERWTAASEAECDRHAAAVLRSTLDVAAALIAVERLSTHRAPPAVYTPAIASADLERRVRALLDDGPRRANLASDLVSVAIVVTGLALLAALWPGDAVHHLAETVLGHVLLH